jgi:hypothetical protein
VLRATVAGVTSAALQTPCKSSAGTFAQKLVEAGRVKRKESASSQMRSTKNQILPWSVRSRGMQSKESGWALFFE